jgi:hypothetical protein
MSRHLPALLSSLAAILFSFLMLLSPICGCQAQFYYGYQVGDEYLFTDTITETFDANETHLLDQTIQSFHIRIQAILDNTSHESIVITTRLQNLSAGLEDYIQVVNMQGYTPIVASPFIYFTHTQWDLHIIDFLESADNYRAATQMTGTVEHDQNARFFQWNLSTFITSTISPYDTDGDGQMDAYIVVSKYYATFSEEGVLLVREFTTQNWFTNGAVYQRIRRVTLDTGVYSPTSPIIPIVIGIVIATTIGLVAVTVFWYRRSPYLRRMPKRS